MILFATVMVLRKKIKGYESLRQVVKVSIFSKWKVHGCVCSLAYVVVGVSG